MRDETRSQQPPTSPPSPTPRLRRPASSIDPTTLAFFQASLIDGDRVCSPRTGDGIVLRRVGSRIRIQSDTGGASSWVEVAECHAPGAPLTPSKPPTPSSPSSSATLRREPEVAPRVPVMKLTNRLQASRPPDLDLPEPSSAASISSLASGTSFLSPHSPSSPNARVRIDTASFSEDRVGTLRAVAAERGVCHGRIFEMSVERTGRTAGNILSEIAPLLGTTRLVAVDKAGSSFFDCLSTLPAPSVLRVVGVPLCGAEDVGPKRG